MQYAILVYESPADQAARDDEAQFAVYMGAHLAFYKALSDAGVYRGGAGLQGAKVATSLRVRGDRRQVQDGPFVDSKEQIGGFYVIEADDLDAALVWAARCPTASTGGVEVRPLLPPEYGPDQGCSPAACLNETAQATNA